MVLQPVVTSYCQPCHGQVTIAPSSSPSPSGPPRWRQVLSIAWNAPPTLKSAICLPPASTHFPVPGGTSPTAATLTKFAMRRLLARAPGTGQDASDGRDGRDGRRAQPRSAARSSRASSSTAPRAPPAEGVERGEDALQLLGERRLRYPPVPDTEELDLAVERRVRVLVERADDVVARGELLVGVEAPPGQADQVRRVQLRVLGVDGDEQLHHLVRRQAGEDHRRYLHVLRLPRRGRA